MSRYERLCGDDTERKGERNDAELHRGEEGAAEYRRRAELAPGTGTQRVKGADPGSGGGGGTVDS